MGTSRAFNCQIPLSGSIHTCWIVPAACAFQHQEVSPNAKNAMELRVSVLWQDVQHDITLKLAKAYDCLVKFEVVGFVKDHVIEVIQWCFPM
jgi:hypothetical protein